MTSGVNLAGHRVHPMLIVFPLGLLATSVIFDLIGLGASSGIWSTMAWYMIGAGIIGGLLAAVVGFLDWLAIPKGTRAKTVGLLHGGLNVIVVLLFAGSWWLRVDRPGNPSGGALTLSYAALVLAVAGGWLGGELVERLGVGVASGANLDAPSSLSGKPAASARTGTDVRRVA